MMMRRHGWEQPLHPLQIVGIAVYCFLVVAFYCFLGLFLGNRIAEITVTTVFSFVALSGMFLFVRCTAIDPSDRTRFRHKKKNKRSKPKEFLKLNYSIILGQIIARHLRRLERKILATFIRRKYLDPWQSAGQMDPLLRFPFVSKDDSIAPNPDPTEDVDISFCSLCDFEVKKNSKHCRSCNRCVEGFDHHCRWLNNCVGKKNYTTFILLMVSVLLMLVIEGGTAVAIFVRCFTDKRGIEGELERRLHVDYFPRGVVAAIAVFLVLLTAYGAAALGQLFFFHVVLIRKGMRTYDYIMAMREENQSLEIDPFEEDSDYSSDDSFISDSPEKKPNFVSRLMCREQGKSQDMSRLSIRIEGAPEPLASSKKQGFRANIDPWKLINMSKEKALLAAEKAREGLMRNSGKPGINQGSLKPLPLETKIGLNIDERNAVSVSPIRRFSSPRRRFSTSPNTGATPKHKYRSNFDLKLTSVSSELETYISRQVLSSVLKKDEIEVSPR